MNANAVPPPLWERLGPEATGGLLEVFETARREWRDDVMAVCAERFERRLVEDTSKLHVAMVQGDAALRHEMSQLGSGLRQEMSQLDSSLRHEMSQLGSSLRREMWQLSSTLHDEMSQLGSSLHREMAQMGSSLRQEMSDGRFELLKWCFLFWMGQVVAVAGVMGLMLRMLRP